MRKSRYSLALRIYFWAIGCQLMVPSINKGKHACQRAFAALFALLTLAGASPPADQKPKIARKSIAGRWEAVLPRRNVSRQGKTRREYLLYFQGA